MKIKKVSNSSIGVSINPSLLKVAGFKLNDKIVIDAEKGIITITKQVEGE